MHLADSLLRQPFILHLHVGLPVIFSIVSSLETLTRTPKTLRNYNLYIFSTHCIINPTYFPIIRRKLQKTQNIEIGVQKLLKPAKRLRDFFTD